VLRGIGLAELLEQSNLLLRSHANTGVGDRDSVEVSRAVKMCRAGALLRTLADR
jgi:hypothetical protein